MRTSPRSSRRIMLAGASGLLLILSYQPFAWPLVAWVALAPLLLALDGARPRAALGLGWLCGTIGGLGVTGYWIGRAAVEYFGLGPAAATLFTMVVIQVFVAPFFALFALLAARLGGGIGRPVCVAAALVVSEWVRVTASGNAWELLGHAVRAVPLLQIVDLTGAYGLSFLLTVTAAAAAEPWRRDGAPRAALATAALALALVTGYGSWRLQHLPAAPTVLPVGAVQGNVSNAARGDPARTAAALQRYVELSAALRPAPLLLVWPENAVAVFPAENAALLAPLHALVAAPGRALLAGAPRAGERPGVAAIYNSAYLFTADGVRPVYDKRRLLPFVERFALRPEDGPYLAGGAAEPVAVDAARLGVLICYEIIDPPLARDLVARGANLLVNLSNDSWFAAGAGPQQHYEIARFRAVENRVALLRVTNSGVSGAFDSAGREIDRLPEDVAVARVVALPLAPGGSFYTRHGDWFAAACGVLVAAAVLVSRSR
ncbi:MAG: apolipoprotein N-acyltransferase [Candidatus Binatia bacterium]